MSLSLMKGGASMAEPGTPAATFKLRGGRLCLDFANTVGVHTGGIQQEKLKSYADLLAWSQQVGSVTDHEAQRLHVHAAGNPAAAAAVLEKAITLREAIYRIFSAVASGHHPAVADLALLNRLLAEALAHAQIVPTAEGFTWGWAHAGDRLDWMLWPIVRSAAELLTSGELGRVRECAGDICGWLFVDMSRNRSRRWCDMQDCGNVAKVRRFRERHQAEDAPHA
jgi:predicted RNA-binding Zn ribbon-like protein